MRKLPIVIIFATFLLSACTVAQDDLEDLKDRIETLEQENAELKQTETGSIEEEDEEPEPKAIPVPNAEPKAITTPAPKPSPKPSVRNCEDSDWYCDPWGSCIGGKQVRGCRLTANCEGGFEAITEQGCVIKVEKPKAPKCTASDWRCIPFSSCDNGVQERTCKLITKCVGGAEIKPATKQACINLPDPNLNKILEFTQETSDQVGKLIEITKVYDPPEKLRLALILDDMNKSLGELIKYTEIASKRSLTIAENNEVLSLMQNVNNKSEEYTDVQQDILVNQMQAPQINIYVPSQPSYSQPSSSKGLTCEDYKSVRTAECALGRSVCNLNRELYELGCRSLQEYCEKEEISAALYGGTLPKECQ